MENMSKVPKDASLEAIPGKTQTVSKRLRPTLTLEGKGNRINVGIDTIRALNSPEYICLLVSIEDKAIGIAPCNEKNPMSFRVPEEFLTKKGKKFRINSKAFVHEYIELMGLEQEKAYVIKGRLDESKQIMVFRLVDGQGKAD